VQKEAGFTLIEIIASLLIVGFMAVFAGMGIVSFTRGYMLAKENAHMTQKAQLAMSRLARELMELRDVTAATPTSIAIEGITGNRTIGLDGQALRIAESGVQLADGDLLIGDVAGFGYTYHYGGSEWTYGMDIRLLSAVGIQLNLQRADSNLGSIRFETTVHPRNNNNYGGAPAIQESQIKTAYCFISSAAGSQESKGAGVVPSRSHLMRPFLFQIVSVAVSLLLFFGAFGLAFHIRFPRRQGGLGGAPAGAFTQYCRILKGSRGSVLVGLILTMVIIAALGAAMVSLTSTSTFTNVWTVNSGRAYFLAESGLRYAASQYLQAPEDDTAVNDLLENLHGQEYTLLNDAGKFGLEIYPYYFVTETDPAGTNTLTTELVGDLPSDLSLSSGRLKIESDVFDYQSAAQNGSQVVFTMSGVMPYVPTGTDVIPAAVSALQNQTVFKNGSLELQAGTGGVFPLHNGFFEVEGHTYVYEANDRDADTLTGITDPADPDLISFSVPSATDVILRKYFDLEATGTYGQGETATSRKLVYHIPLPVAEEQKKEFIERDWGTAGDTSDLPHWKDSALGTHEVQEIGGDRALMVTGTEPAGGASKASLIELDWSTTEVDLAEAWAYGDENALSYDAQVKIGFDDTIPPESGGFDPIPIPKYFVAGLSFRLDDDGNSYGLSFLRGDNSIPSPYDNIDDDMVPLDDEPLIVLWQQTDSGTNRTWLAYKVLNESDDILEDDVEGGQGEWTASGLWHIAGHRYQSASQSWYYGRDSTRTYNTGSRTYGYLVSPSINLCYAGSAVLSFWSWYETEPAPYENTYDLKYVDVSTNGGSSWTQVYQLTVPANPMETWQLIQIDLSAYLGSVIKVRFRFDSRDAIANGYEGWYVDDIVVAGENNYLLNESTLIVRVDEPEDPAMLDFINGEDTNGDGIEDGDVIVGQTSNSTAVVLVSPQLSSGSWQSGSAAGSLSLEKVRGAFTSGEVIKVSGSQTSAEVSSIEIWEKSNFIRAYYGDPNGCGTPDGDLLDNLKDANSRGGDIHWPPEDSDDWAADDDFFTLVQWDAVNSSVSSVEIVSSQDEPDAVIRSSALTSPGSGVFTRSELGLHTFGHGGANVYFDDFALQTDIVEIKAVTPIQE